MNKETNSTKTSLLRDQRGLSTVEYIIILVLIAVGGIAGWQTFGGKIFTKIDNSNTAMDGVEAPGN